LIENAYTYYNRNFKYRWAENFVKQLATGLGKKHSVFLLLTSVDYGQRITELQNVKLIYPWRLFNSFIGLPYWIFQFQYVIQWIQFRLLLIYYNIEIVHSHLYRSDYKIYKWLRWSHMPWMIGMHGCYEDYLFMEDNSTISQNDFNRMNDILSRVNFVAMASEKNATIFKYTLRKPLTQVINFGLAVDSIFPRQHLGKKTWIIGIVSRGIESKGWQIGIEAFNQLKIYIPQIKLKLFYSETPYMLGLKERWKGYSDIEFIGFKDNILKEMREMDILLFPSFFVSESQPITIIEALASGIPVVATDIGEIPRMLGVGSQPSGFCVPLEDNGMPGAEKLAMCLKNLIFDPDLYNAMARAAIKNFKPFDINRCVDQYTMLYSNLINRTIE